MSHMGAEHTLDGSLTTINSPKIVQHPSSPTPEVLAFRTALTYKTCQQADRALTRMTIR